MSKVEVVLPEHLERFAREKVARDGYADLSDLLRHALEQLRDAEIDPDAMTDAQKAAYVRAAIAEGLEDIRLGRVSDFDVEDLLREARRS